MAKRKLTRQQAWRVEKIQQERLTRARRKGVDMATLADERLGPERRGLIIANFGASVELDDSEGISYRCRLRQNLETLVPGDRVIWQPVGEQREGVVVALESRHTLLARPDARGELRPLAANIDQILVVAAPRPAYSTDLIDQYLVAAEHNGIHPLIIMNKSDLALAPGEQQTITRDLERYERLGYQAIRASTRTAHGLDRLIAVLRDKVSVFVGQSGVGKSSLVQRVLPDKEIRVGALMESSGLGRHTTSASRYYQLPTGGAIIDSPGVREFSLWHMEPQALAQGFIEFRPYLGHCRFRDCRHRDEPGCALHDAVESGTISPQRLASYHRMVAAQEQAAR